MATTTTNYGLTKPTILEEYDINVQNTNMDIIDTALTAKVSNSQMTVSGSAVSGTLADGYFWFKY